MGKIEFFEQMYSKYFDKLPDKEEYLRRIGLGGAEIPLTKEGLDALQLAHLCSVPFENIDIFDYDVPVDFGTEETFGKIVTRRRGGYCFELNAIYTALLEAVGFETHAIGVRIVADMEGCRYTPSISHRAAIVTIGGKRYYSDVGYGMTSAPGISICIDEQGEQDVLGEIYTVEDRPYNSKTILRHAADGASELFNFVPDPFNVPDFIPYNTTIQALGFRAKRMVNLRTPDGGISIDGDIFRRTENGRRTETHLPDAEAACKVLADEFGIVLTQPLRDSAVDPLFPF